MARIGIFAVVLQMAILNQVNSPCVTVLHRRVARHSAPVHLLCHTGLASNFAALYNGPSFSAVVPSVTLQNKSPEERKLSSARASGAAAARAAAVDWRSGQAVKTLTGWRQKRFRNHPGFDADTQVMCACSASLERLFTAVNSRRLSTDQTLCFCIVYK